MLIAGPHPEMIAGASVIQPADYSAAPVEGYLNAIVRKKQSLSVPVQLDVVEFCFDHLVPLQVHTAPGRLPPL